MYVLTRGLCTTECEEGYFVPLCVDSLLEDFAWNYIDLCLDDVNGEYLPLKMVSQC